MSSDPVMRYQGYGILHVVTKKYLYRFRMKRNIILTIAINTCSIGCFMTRPF